MKSRISFFSDSRGRSENEKILKLHPAIIGSHVKSKICCFLDRRGRRSLQAKIQTASTRRYGAKTLSFPGRRGRRPLQAKCLTISTRRYGTEFSSLCWFDEEFDCRGGVAPPVFCIDVCFSFGRGDPSPTKENDVISKSSVCYLWLFFARRGASRSARPYGFDIVLNGRPPRLRGVWSSACKKSWRWKNGRSMNTPTKFGKKPFHSAFHI